MICKIPLECIYPCPLVHQNLNISSYLIFCSFFFEKSNTFISNMSLQPSIIICIYLQCSIQGHALQHSHVLKSTRNWDISIMSFYILCFLIPTLQRQSKNTTVHKTGIWVHIMGKERKIISNFTRSVKSITLKKNRSFACGSRIGNLLGSRKSMHDLFKW